MCVKHRTTCLRRSLHATIVQYYCHFMSWASSLQCNLLSLPDIPCNQPHRIACRTWKIFTLVSLALCKLFNSVFLSFTICVTHFQGLNHTFQQFPFVFQNEVHFSLFSQKSPKKKQGNIRSLEGSNAQLIWLHSTKSRIQIFRILI